MAEYRKKTLMPVSAQALFSWHEKRGTFKRLSPPWQPIKLIRQDPTLKPGSEVHFRIKKGPLSFLWIAQHTEYEPPNEFVDTQVKGPFKKWIHRHRMIPVNSKKSELEDIITFQTPRYIPKELAIREIKRMTDYRHATLLHDLQTQQTFPSRSMVVAMTGASGMIGSALRAFLETADHKVLPLVRHPPFPGEIGWNPMKGTIDQKGLEKVDVVINLAGENIGSGRWSQSKKKRIVESRVKATQLLVKTLNNLKHPPKVFISVSAMGYYGQNVLTSCTESEKAGSDFLASVCVKWENEANRYQAGRYVIPRLGIVLSASGGVLSKILPPFRLGLGGVIGNGDQQFSWIALDDLVYSIYRLMIDDSFSGPVNLCCPNPVTNYELTKTLGKILHRPTILPIPSMVMHAAFGEKGDATLLANCHAIPKVLQDHQHPFYYGSLEEALRHTLGKNR